MCNLIDNVILILRTNKPTDTQTNKQTKQEQIEINKKLVSGKPSCHDLFAFTKRYIKVKSRC